jgi:hypothetical protein
MLSGHNVNSSARRLTALAALTVLLFAAGGAGMAYIAGFGHIHRVIEGARWWWLVASVGAVLVAFLGYLLAYWGVKRVEDGPRLTFTGLLAVVTAGFGGFLAHGGTALDEFAMRAGGADKREAKVRTTALAGFEHGVLAIIVCPAAIVSLLLAVVIPRPDFTWPWALIPPVGFALAILVAEHYRDRMRDRDGWRGKVGIFYDAIHVVWSILSRPRRYGYATLGMMLYWGCDMFALWAATRAFGWTMTPLAIIVALGTGMILTRRTAPLGGAGVMIVALVPTLWYGAAVPFASATMGVVAYRFFTLFVPMPGAFASLPKLRELGRRGEEAPTGHGTSTNKGEPALSH